LKISIFGLGYVGVVGVACLAKLGHRVIGVDVSKNKVELINQGKSPIVENEIDSIIAEQHRLGMIQATVDPVSAIRDSGVSFICVGTPSTPEGHLNLEAVMRVARHIGEGIRLKSEFHVVAVRSTVLPGTNEKITAIIQEASGKYPNQDFSVVSNPEFLREGTAVKDYYDPPYTLIGSTCPIAIGKLKEIYKDITAPVITTEVRTAELIKYVNNAFHALKITFANEVGNICKRIGVNSHELMKIFLMDTRLNISSYYLKPGFAYGGSCLPKDLKALKTIAHDLYLSCPIIANIERSNELQKDAVLRQILDFGKQKVGFLGLSFKAGTDDLRNSPIVDILEKLLGKGLDIKVYDRNVQVSQLIGSNKDFIFQKIPLISKYITNDIRDIVRHSEVVVVVNNEDEFKDILREVGENVIIYDLVNIENVSSNRKSNYFGISW
jgi:GDP-mannose 6-dehydrogenase